jgi:hypothetical protein
MSSFSGWGPTDDGRIKPDLCANGIGLYSSTAGGNSSYSSYSGTSMASPNLSGSANLVADHFAAVEGDDPTAAMLKAILIHTAHEAGAAPGPDYAHGWGLLNTLGAVQVVEADGATPGRLRQASLADGATDEYWFSTAAAGAYRATIVWTDPPGVPPADALDPPDLVLVNDLDVRVTDVVTAATYEPWVLDPQNPGAGATTGDDFRDNVEQVWVASLPAGFYRVTVTHKGALDGGLPQDYALVSDESLSTAPPATAVDPGVRVARGLSLDARPNPFAGATAIRFELAQGADVTLEIWDVRGRLVRAVVVGRPMPAAAHELGWDGRDAGGRAVAAGVYFARLTAGPVRATEKLLRVRVE